MLCESVRAQVSAFLSSECRLINSNWVECLKPVSLLCTVDLLWADIGPKEKKGR